jgi:hypothetical protein
MRPMQRKPRGLNQKHESPRGKYSGK